MAHGYKSGGKDFKPGHKSKGGRPKTAPDILEARKLTRTEFENKLQKFIHLPKEELQRIFKAPKTPMIEMFIVSILLKGVVQGDQKRLEFLIDRLIGKVAQPISMEGGLQLSPNSDEYRKMFSDPKIKKNLKEISKTLSDKKK